MLTSYRVLVVDDDYQQAALVCELLRAAGAFAVDLAMDLAHMWDHLNARPYDAMLFADRLADRLPGADIVTQMSAHNRLIPVVIMSERGDERAAVQAIQQGAADYVIKRGEFLLTLPILIPRAIRAYRLRLAQQCVLERDQSVADSLPEAVVAWNPEGRIVLWNTSAESLWGWSGIERVGRSVQDCYFSLFAPPLAPSAGAGPEEAEVVRQARNRKDEAVQVNTRLIPVYDPAAGEVAAYIHIVRGTARLRHEAADQPGSSLEMLHDS